MLYKFIDEHRVKNATNPLFIDGVAYSNPSKDTLTALGYKELVMTEEMPVQEGYYAMPLYKDGDKIIKRWELVKDEEGVI